MIEPALEYLRERRNAGKHTWAVAIAVDAHAAPAGGARRRLIERRAGYRRTVWGPAKTRPPARRRGLRQEAGRRASKQLGNTADGKGRILHVPQERFRAARRPISSPTRCPSLILKTPFPKTMYWTGKGGARFIRPIRWIVALLGDEVIPFEIAGVTARQPVERPSQAGRAAVPVTFENYEQKLRDNFVILSAEERRKRIRAVRSAVSMRYRCSTRWLTSPNGPRRSPAPSTRSSYAAERSADHSDAVPPEILFGGDRKTASLPPQFVAVTNTGWRSAKAYPHGNERVLRARFNDARFFWDADQKTHAGRPRARISRTSPSRPSSALSRKDRAHGSDLVTASWAAMRTADARGAALARPISPPNWSRNSPNCRASSAASTRARRANRKKSRRPSTTTTSRSAWKIPFRARTPGALLAIADKLDTLRGCFSVGLIPSGSKDPFALRRAAQGIVKILVEGKLRLPIATAVRAATPSSKSSSSTASATTSAKSAASSTTKSTPCSPPAGAIWPMSKNASKPSATCVPRRTSNRWPPAFKRIRTSCEQARFSGAERRSIRRCSKPVPEADLYPRYQQTLQQIAGADYSERSAAIAALRPQVDLFFDKVLVNAPDRAGAPQPADAAQFHAGRIFHHRGFFRNRNHLPRRQ